LNYNNIYQLWQNKGSTFDAAVELTLQQLDSLEAIASDDKSWDMLLEISARGRNTDAWLAADWPTGFDELLICVPLCKLVDWECAKCTIGSRQENYSCAMDYSVFGFIGELVKSGSRKELLDHINNVRKMLKNPGFEWNIHTCSLDLIKQ
jgi:hypothetical protein